MEKPLIYGALALAAYWLYSQNRQAQRDFDANAAAAKAQADAANGPAGWFNSAGGLMRNGAGFAAAGATAVSQLASLVQSFGFGSGGNQTADARSDATTAADYTHFNSETFAS